MRVKYADATHISCGYRLENSAGPFNQGYFDNNEYGAGRSILQAIKDRAATAVTVFIVRYYGGIKLGKRRYEINAMLTTATLTTLQYKMLQQQSTRNRALSQGSIASSISGASDIEEIPNNEVRVNGTLQDQAMATPED